MKTKLTRQELQALLKMLSAMVGYWQPTDDLYDILLYRMMLRLKNDLLKKYIDDKKQYRVNWHPERALAFWCVMSIEVDNMKAHPYEHGLLTRLLNQIHQEVACSHLQPSS